MALVTDEYGLVVEPAAAEDFPVGAPVMVHAMGSWYAGQVVKVTPKRVTVSYTSGAGVTREKAVGLAALTKVRPFGRQDKHGSSSNPYVKALMVRPASAAKAKELPKVVKNTAGDACEAEERADRDELHVGYEDDTYQDCEWE